MNDLIHSFWSHFSSKQLNNMVPFSEHTLWSGNCYLPKQFLSIMTVDSAGPFTQESCWSMGTNTLSCLEGHLQNLSSDVCKEKQRNKASNILLLQKQVKCLFCSCNFMVRSQVIVVSAVTRLWVGWSKVCCVAGERASPLLGNIQTSSGAYPASS